MKTIIVLILWIFTPTLSFAQSVDFIHHEEPLLITYSFQYFSRITDSEFLQLQSQVKENPEHPSRRNYEKELRYRTDGPETVEHMICLLDNEVVRFNTSNTNNSIYADIGLDGDALWQMSQQQLSVIPAGGDLPEGAPDMKSRVDQVTREFGFLWTNGKSLSSAMRVGQWDDVSDGRMLAVGEKMTLEYSTDGDVGKVVVVSSSNYPGIVGDYWEFSGRLEQSLIDQNFSSKMAEFSSDGNPIRVLEIMSVQSLGRESAIKYQKMPKINGDDPVRGEVTFTGIYDYRLADPKITVQGPDGLVVVKQSDTDFFRANRWIRLIGWVTAGVLVGTLVVLRIKRK